jgi:hypothetical protein
MKNMITLILLSGIMALSIFAVLPIATSTASNPDDVAVERGSTYVLTSGVSKYASVTTTSTGKYDDFYITVGSTPTAITAVLDTVGTDDLDVYYKFGAKASSTSYNLAATTSSADESLSLTSTYLKTGTHYFRVQRYGGTGTDYYYFKVTVTTGGTPPPSDTTAPTTALTAPAAGATVSGTTTISASASDNVAVTKVEFYVDSALKGTDTSSPYSYSWDTTAYSNAAHTLYTKAYDAAGNIGTSASRSVTVSNSVPSDDGGLLTAGVTANGNMDSADGADMWWIDVPTGTTSMYVVLECGSADFDTYGKFNAQPTTSSYDWRGYTSGGEENTVTNPSVGRHYIMVDYYSGSGAYTLKVTLTTGTTPPAGDWGTGGKYAIIMGISNYQSISDLSYCDEDALDWYNFLSGKGYECHVFYDGSYTSNSFTSIPAANKIGYGTEANVRGAIQGLAAHAVSGNSVAYITSGHGSGTGTGSSYLCMYDCSGSAGCYYDTEIAADLGLFASGVKIFFFVDHCYSGGLGPEIMALSNNDYIYVSTTCTANGYGYDDSAHHNGAWTYYFLENYLVSHSTSSMEAVFDAVAPGYPYTGGDAPMEFDGLTSSAFYL